MRYHHFGLTIILVLLAVSTGGCLTTNGRRTVPDSATEIRPIAIGERMPSLTLRTVDGEKFNLNDALRRQPTVLIVYRGGWCPYCNMHLSKLRKIETRLVELGYQLLAISPDRPEKLRETISKQKVHYTLLSDSKAEAAMALGLAFRVDEATRKKYVEYGIDLKDASGEEHSILPVPAVIVVDREEKVRFIRANPDYKQRMPPEQVLAAARAVIEQDAEREK